jgi:iron complex outermembrane receptor protein
MNHRFLFSSVSIIVLQLAIVPTAAVAQTATKPLPEVTIDAPGQARPAASRPSREASRAARPRRARAPAAVPPASVAIDQPAVVQTTAGAVQGYRALSAASATKTDTPIERIPQNIVVIPRSVIEDQGATTVSEAVTNVSNVRPPTRA